jgi:hypothetical protein
MRILRDGFIVEDREDAHRPKSALKNILVFGSLLVALAGLTTLALRSEYRRDQQKPARWEEQIEEIVSYRQNGLYAPADLKQSWLHKEIAAYENARTDGSAFESAIPEIRLKEIKRNLEWAATLTDTNKYEF